ncbi:5-methylthioadenosine/S-adenosylhomocysteine deaminase [Bienertia sinuspersici]
MMQMDMLLAKPTKRSNYNSYYYFSSNSFNISLFSHSFRTYCSKNPSQQPQQNGDDDTDPKNNKKGDKFSIDWDKAWSSFKKQGKKSLLSQFSPNKYVTWNPRRSNYPLSEEVDPIKRTERSNLMLWTSPKFTLGGAIVIVSLLLLYTILAPMK